MTGKGHLVSGTACLVITDSMISGVSGLLKNVSFLHNRSILDVCRSWALDVWIPSFINSSGLHIQAESFKATGGTAAAFVYISWLIYFVLFLIGNLLPDIDTPNSMLGRFFHLPVQHHRITHTVWFMLPFLIGGIWIRALFWIGLGYFFHLFIDSFGRAGNCWFYPISRYLEYSSGAFVKKGHFLKLYRTGGVSEGVCCAVIVAVMIAAIVLRIIF